MNHWNDRTWARRSLVFTGVLLVAGTTGCGQNGDGRIDVQQQGTSPARTAVLTPPTEGPGVSADDVRDALDLLASDVVNISFNGSDVAGYDVFSSASYFPTLGGDFFVMSTGDTASALLPNTSDSTSTELGGLNTVQGEDLVQVTLVLTPPSNATCLAFDFAFYSEEFPEFVGSQFNDAFIAEFGSSTFQQIGDQIIAPNNFAFDSVGNVISVNTVFGVSAANAAGTTYDGATPLLTAKTPLDGSSQVTIILSIMDLGDSIYDSTAFIDNFRWLFGIGCEPGADADTDRDSLLNGWETAGIDFDNDGTIDLDLPAFGADPMHKDIFVEIDYMVLPGPTGHTHKPKADALQAVIDAFANAPVSNPDGTTGINIHIDAGSDTIMNPVTGDLWGTLSEADALTHVDDLGTGSYDWSAFDAIKGVGVPGKFSILRADAFHYCIFSHDLSAALGSTSGVSRGIPASDFIVSLGSWTGSTGTVNQQAGTLLHELGHNLTFKHGGNDHANYKPNYISVMNYFFQTRGLRFMGSDGLFDYSRFQLPDLTESNLDETVGLSGVAEAANYGTRFFDPAAMQRVVNDLNGAIDWNWDGDALDTMVSVDVNNSGGLTVLGNSDNWDEIVFNGGAVGHLGEAIVLPTVTPADEVTEDLDLQIPTDYRVVFDGPGLVSLPVCESDVYQFEVMNTGLLDDTYSLDFGSDQGWPDTSGLPASLTLAAGESTMLTVPVYIPPGTVPGTLDVLVVRATSVANPLVMDASETTVVALDDLPPVIEVGEIEVLWPPNHKYHEFSLSDLVTSVEDSCDGQLNVDSVGAIMHIYSDEPEDAPGNGDGDTLEDIVILGPSSFKVRAERMGGGNGRVYGVSFEVVDSTGHTSQSIAYVIVPHDKKDFDAFDDGPGAGYTVP